MAFLAEVFHLDAAIIASHGGKVWSVKSKIFIKT
ncbi:MAG: hypothetical protein FMNOHCHN_03301 [Ignavibacteriaceae bacterium]|nr:hypothetical protein [Ignavibacteriaceae bacterium]